jgi:hypothetical protein
MFNGLIKLRNVLCIFMLDVLWRSVITNVDMWRGDLK